MPRAVRCSRTLRAAPPGCPPGTLPFPLTAGAASREVEGQLQSSGAVYDRLWQQRAHELQNAAQLLARDFGFRAAVATGDEATMQSALRNAAARLRVPTAFIVSADGRVSALDPSIGNSRAAPLCQPLHPRQP